MRQLMLHRHRTWIISLLMVWGYVLIPALSLSSTGVGTNGLGRDICAPVAVGSGNTAPLEERSHHIVCPFCLLQAGGGFGTYLISNISHVWPEPSPLRIWRLSTAIGRSGSTAPERPGSPRGPPTGYGLKTFSPSSLHPLGSF
ncbi:hypothetical protein [Leptothrix ochracea]|uniref:hypothetical protein n=1 Tax=Leptothrix ochracea TaxID=735331 RepID=UPI0034E1FB11